MELNSPDLAISDLALPEYDGLELIEWTRIHSSRTRAIVLTMYDETQYLQRALELGACGYVLKDDTESDLRNCIETALDGDTYVSPRFGRKKERLYPLKDRDTEMRLQSLSELQKNILMHVANFKTSKEIANELGLSYRTVQNHRANIAAHLNLKGANQLLQFTTRYTLNF